MEKDLYWYWFQEAPGASRTTKLHLLEHFSSPEVIYYVAEEELKPFFYREFYLHNFINSRKTPLVIRGYNRMLEKGVQFVHMDSKEYPERLRVIPDPPIALYLKGRLPIPEEPTIAIIGARECTRYGSEMARFFGRELGRAGVQIVSGLARGIDGMAHGGALESDTYTIGVLGCGIDVVYPEENYRLFMKMEQCGGILSESGLGVKASAGLFPQRNRLISGLSDGILVVEAMEKSGTFITVDQGLEQGKEIFALPGRNIDVKSRGCNNLIKMGAHIVTEVSDILEILQTKSTESMKVAELTDIDKFVR